MPIKSTKPAMKGPYQGKAPKPHQSDISEAKITSSRKARAQVNKINNLILSMTQPYNRAAELRAGNAFRNMQEAAIRAENVGNAPYRGFGNANLGLKRPLPDVGP